MLAASEGAVMPYWWSVTLLRSMRATPTWYWLLALMMPAIAAGAAAACEAAAFCDGGAGAACGAADVAAAVRDGGAVWDGVAWITA